MVWSGILNPSIENPNATTELVWTKSLAWLSLRQRSRSSAQLGLVWQKVGLDASLFPNFLVSLILRAYHNLTLALFIMRELMINSNSTTAGHGYFELQKYSKIRNCFIKELFHTGSEPRTSRIATLDHVDKTWRVTINFSCLWSRQR